MAEVDVAVVTIMIVVENRHIVSNDSSIRSGDIVCDSSP